MISRLRPNTREQHQPPSGNIIASNSIQWNDGHTIHFTKFFDPKKTFLRFPTAGFKRELLPSLAGDMSFNEAKVKAENIELDGVNVPIIGYDDLIKNKTLTNRLKDLADIEELAKRKKGLGI